MFTGERTSLVDEYDNQDFLRGLLRMFFDDIRSENYVAEYAGEQLSHRLLPPGCEARDRAQAHPRVAQLGEAR